MKCLTVLGILLTALTAAFSADSAGTVRLSFNWQHHYAKPVFNLPVFRNVHGQVYSISMLRYYVGNVSLHRDDGSIHNIPGYHLVIHDDDTDASTDSESTIDLTQVPRGVYTSLSFTVGIDSADNVSGPREGALDPLHGMYWTWATGYIFFKLEGSSPASSQPKQLVEYHIGGFSAPYNNVQRITLSLRRPLIVDGTKQSTIDVEFDAGKFIDADGGIDFSVMSGITDAQHASKFAPRLKGAFSVR